jgi:hypothetical protein
MELIGVTCPACGANWDMPDTISPQRRSKVAALVHAHDPLAAMAQLREGTTLTLRDVKAITLHVSDTPGQCHRCGATLADEPEVVCPSCGSLNYNW